MEAKLDKNSTEYYLISEFSKRLQNSSNQTLKETYREGRLIYLDDDIEAQKEYVQILENLADYSFDEAPNHLKGELRNLELKEIKDIMSEYQISLYGRSGMRIHSKELKKYEN